MKTALEYFFEERTRQVDVKGYDADHDEMETAFQLSSAAALFICNAQNQYFKDHSHYDDRGDVVRFEGRSVTDDEDEELKWKQEWPWKDHDGRPDADILTSLIKAGALIAAEVDRLLASGEVVKEPNQSVES